MQHVTLVFVDNGDIEPEIWAFESFIKASEFARHRAGTGLAGCSVRDMGILSDAEADEIITTEKEQI